MTPQYRNGLVPESLLVVFNRGYNAADGNWTHSLPPATYARHLALVDLAKKRTGRLLRPGVGWTCYRPFFAQVFLKERFGIYAATAGTSSHGLIWEGRQCAAIDYGNWDEVYDGFGGRDAFFADCRKVGFSPGLISKARGYVDEWWHVIDLNCWSAVPVFAGVAVLPFIPNPTEPIPEEEDDMKQAFVIVKEPRGAFAVVGAGASVGLIPSSAALRGVSKIVKAFRVDQDEPVVVELSGEEWDAGTLGCFR